MTQTSNLYRATAKALVLNERQQFLLFRENNGLWEIPGGGIDYGEKPQDTLKPEFAEEAGLEVTDVSDHPSYYVTALNIDGNWKSAAVYETKLRNLNFTQSDECMELRFFTKEEVLNERLYPITLAFVNAFDPQRHSPKTNSA